MIVCSCNVFSDHQVRSTVANATQRLRMSQIYDHLGSGAQCGRCAHIIKRIIDEMTNRAIGHSQCVHPDTVGRSCLPVGRS
jgi:bacterioferritin-associated ferredoxin